VCSSDLTPETIRKAIRKGIESELKAQKTARMAVQSEEETFEPDELAEMLEKEMLDAAHNLQFERAATLRDQLTALKKMPTDERGQEGARREVRLSDIEGQVEKKSSNKPGAARSRAGRTGPKKKKRG